MDGAAAPKAHEDIALELSATLPMLAPSNFAAIADKTYVAETEDELVRLVDGLGRYDGLGPADDANIDAGDLYLATSHNCTGGWPHGLFVRRRAPAGSVLTAFHGELRDFSPAMLRDERFMLEKAGHHVRIVVANSKILVGSDGWPPPAGSGMAAFAADTMNMYATFECGRRTDTPGLVHNAEFVTLAHSDGSFKASVLVATRDIGPHQEVFADHGATSLRMYIGAPAATCNLTRCGK